MDQAKVSKSKDVTVVVLTKNEESQLADCLDAIPSKYSVVVLDSGSSDRTLDIARAKECAIHHNAWPGFAQQRNFALSKCNIESAWVLFIDADERFPQDLFDWIEQCCRERDDFDVAMIPSLLVFKGVTLRHAPGYPIYHPRLVRKGSVRFVTNHTGHGETIEEGARIIHATEPYLHRFYDGDLDNWMRKHISLAREEAQMLAARGVHVTFRAKLSRRYGKRWYRVPLRFFYHYLLRRGFMDGRAGLEYSIMYTWFEATKLVVRVAGRVS